MVYIMSYTLKATIDLAIQAAVKTAVQQAKKEAILECRPVGSYFITETEDDPNILFGGGWQKLTGRYVLQCSDANHKAGTTVEAGLPNITGHFSATNNVCLNGIADKDTPLVFAKNDGCFSFIDGSGERALVANISVHGVYADKRRITFSASSSNNIYGNSDTVQPPARIVNVWKRIS